MLSDHCKDVNRTVLHRLNQTIEMLNATSFNVGNPNLRDFSRLGIEYVSETIMKNFKTTLTDLQNVAKEWLRYAGDRVRYQQKKELNAVGKYL